MSSTAKVTEPGQISFCWIDSSSFFQQRAFLLLLCAAGAAFKGGFFVLHGAQNGFFFNQGDVASETKNK